MSDLAEIMDGFGFALQGTGGNCTAYVKEAKDHTLTLTSVQHECTAPESLWDEPVLLVSEGGPVAERTERAFPALNDALLLLHDTAEPSDSLNHAVFCLFILNEQRTGRVKAEELRRVHALLWQRYGSRAVRPDTMAKRIATVLNTGRGADAALLEELERAGYVVPAVVAGQRLYGHLMLIGG